MPSIRFAFLMYTVLTDTVRILHKLTFLEKTRQNRPKIAQYHTEYHTKKAGFFLGLELVSSVNATRADNKKSPGNPRT